MAYLLRTVQLDKSDQHAYPVAAEPGEWAVPGSFLFADLEPDSLTGKRRVAFTGGWVGVDSLGFSTFVEIVACDAADLDQAALKLARHFVERFGAPDLEVALPVAREEVDYAASLCTEKAHTLLALQRSHEAAGIRESFRVIRPERAPDHAPIWSIEPDE